MSIVVIGNFNPAIIQPFWLAQKKLIREQEAQTAHVEVIHPSIAKFKLEWCEFEILTERFEVKTNQEGLFESMKDLIISIFSILKETPVKAIGINHMFYYSMPDERRYFEVGNKLGSLSLWNKIFKDTRLFTLEVGEMSRDDGQKGSVKVRIQPPDIPLPSPYGILVYVNDHYDINPEEGAAAVSTLLSNSFAASLERSSKIPINIWESINIS